MILLTLIISILYAFLIISLIIGFDKVQEFKSVEVDPSTTFSIIIPFRNEAENLIPLLNSLARLSYPKEFFEVLLVDDDSTDDSVAMIEGFKSRHPSLQMQVLKNVRSSDSPKKDAISVAMQQARYNYILTTDADCIVPTLWLGILDAYIQTHQAQLIAAPVAYTMGATFLEQFQFFDFLSLQTSRDGGFGLGKPFMCNGANLCYLKEAFFEVKGYEGNEQIASGDDIFLLEKMLSHAPEEVHYLKSKEAIVRTAPERTLRAFISQRIRWASKTSTYKNPAGKVIATLVLAENILIIVLWVAMLLNTKYVGLFLAALFAKLLLDHVLMDKGASLFNLKFGFIHLIRGANTYWKKVKHPLSFYLLTILTYPFYTVYVAFLSFKKSYLWKDRSFKN